MGRLAQNGVAVLVIFSKLPEITGICDRIMVMRDIQSKVGNRFDHGRSELVYPAPNRTEGKIYDVGSNPDAARLRASRSGRYCCSSTVLGHASWSG